MVGDVCFKSDDVPYAGFFRESGFNQRLAVVAGAGSSGRKVPEYFDLNRWMGIKVIGVFDQTSLSVFFSAFCYCKRTNYRPVIFRRKTDYG